MKNVLISIQPKWCELIASGKKTVEVRKTRPKLETPFKCYIYETQSRTETPFVDEEGHEIFKGRGQVIGEFVCDEIYETRFAVDFEYGNQYWDVRYNSGDDCLSDEELAQYIGNKAVYYGWHISDLVIYDKPKELSSFWTIKCTNKKVGCSQCYIKPNCIIRITRPPQSWCYVEGVAE